MQSGTTRVTRQSGIRGSLSLFGYLSWRNMRQLVIAFALVCANSVFAQEDVVIGRVVDRDTGLPIEGVSVSANGGNTTTDVNGEYSFDLDQFTRQDGSISVSGSSIYRRSAVGGGTLSLEPPFPIRFDFTAVLAPESVLQGRVVDGFGNPVPNVDVDIRATSIDPDFGFPDSVSLFESTDSEGIYSVAGNRIEESQALSGLTISEISLREEGFLDIRQQFSPPLETDLNFPFQVPDLVLLEIDDTLAVTGQVVDRDTGQPLEGVTVSANGGNTTTDASGNYSFMLNQLSRQSGSVSISGSGIYRRSGVGGGSLILEPPFPKQFDFTAVLAPDSILQGQVVDGFGNPVPNVDVSIRATSIDPDFGFPDSLSLFERTNSEGEYSVAGSRIEESQALSGITISEVSLRKTGFLDIGMQFNPPLQTDLVFPFLIDPITLVEIDDTLAVIGQVIDRDTGLPLEGVTVSANGGSTSTGADGSYSFRINQFSRQSGTVSVSGSRIYRRSGVGGGSLVLEPPFPKQFDFTAVQAPESLLQGQVVDNFGNPIPSVDVQIRATSIDPDFGFPDSLSFSERTDADGVYSVAGSGVEEFQAISGLTISVISLRKDKFLDISEQFNPPLQTDTNFPFMLPGLFLTCVEDCLVVDDDNDLVSDIIDLCFDTPAGEVVDSNGCSDSQVDADGDGFCNLDVLSFGPGVCGGVDNCPVLFNSDQLDFDNDSSGDECDIDDDNDGLADTIELEIGLSPLSTDSDNNGTLDGDEDSDMDGVTNILEVQVGSDPSDGSDAPPVVTIEEVDEEDTVVEENEEIVITVERVGNINERSVVIYRLSGTALIDEDFIVMQGTTDTAFFLDFFMSTANAQDVSNVTEGRLVWEAGDDTARTITIIPIQDDEEEGPETIQLALIDENTGTAISNGVLEITLSDAVDTPPVTVYQHVNFRGNALNINEGDVSIGDLRASSVGNDVISSIEIDPGYEVLACRHSRFRGRCEIFTGSITDLREISFNDTISSLSVRQASSVPATVYRHVSFRGRSLDIEEGEVSIRDLRASGVGNDAISSIRIAAGYEVLACKHSRFRGRCETFSSSTSDLREIRFNDKVSSLKVLRVQ